MNSASSDEVQGIVILTLIRSMFMSCGRARGAREYESRCVRNFAKVGDCECRSSCSSNECPAHIGKPQTLFLPRCGVAQVFAFSAPEHIMKGHDVVSDHLVDSKPSAVPFFRGARESLGKCTVGCKPEKCCCKGFNVSRGNEQSGILMLNSFRNASDVGRNNRLAEGHCLEERHRHTLCATREASDVSRVKDFWDVQSLSENADDTIFASKPPNVLKLRTAAHDQSPHSRIASMRLLDCADEDFDALLRPKSRDENGEKIVSANAEPRSHD
jgi:hypothetical protein